MAISGGAGLPGVGGRASRPTGGAGLPGQSRFRGLNPHIFGWLDPNSPQRRGAQTPRRSATAGNAPPLVALSNLPGGNQPKPPGFEHTPDPGFRLSGQATGPSALDSTYWTNVNANQFRTNNSLNAINLQNTEQGTALQNALAQLAYQQPRQSLALEQGANRRGGLYSSVYDQQLGDLGTQFANRQSADVGNYEQQLAANTARASALQGAIPLFNAQQAAAAAIRASQQAANNPATGNGNPAGSHATGGAAIAPPPHPGGHPSRSRTTGNGAPFRLGGRGAPRPTGGAGLPSGNKGKGKPPRLITRPGYGYVSGGG